MMNTAKSLTALVLAASRKGEEDPVARLQDKTHKCLVTIDGRPMLEITIQTLIDSGCFSRILVSIENESVLAELPLTMSWIREGKIALVPSAETLADSLILLHEQDPQLLPVVITTADNALHTPELIRDFVQAFESSGADVSVAATTEAQVLKDYPDEGIKFFRFSDGGVSFCNLFGIHTDAGVNAVNIFRSGGQFQTNGCRESFGPPRRFQ